MYKDAGRHPHQRAHTSLVWLTLFFALAMASGCGGAAPQLDEAQARGALDPNQERGKDEIVPGLKKPKPTSIQRPEEAMGDASFQPGELQILTDDFRDLEEQEIISKLAETDLDHTSRALDKKLNPLLILDADDPAGEGIDWTRKRASARVNMARRRIVRLLKPLDSSTHTLIADQLASSHAPCEQTCQLSDAICQSARVICEVSEQYPGADDISSDCVWASLECEGAKTLCTRCLAR